MTETKLRHRSGNPPKVKPPYFTTWVNEIIAFLIQNGPSTTIEVRDSTGYERADQVLRRYHKRGIFVREETPRQRANDPKYTYDVTDREAAFKLISQDREPPFSLTGETEDTNEETEPSITSTVSLIRDALSLLNQQVDQLEERLNERAENLDATLQEVRDSLLESLTA